MFGIPWVYESTFSTVNCMKCKYWSSISGESLAYELRYGRSVKYTQDFIDLVQKKFKITHYKFFVLSIYWSENILDSLV